MKMFFQEWIHFFKELKSSLGNLWKKYCPKFCSCDGKKEKGDYQNDLIKEIQR